MFVQSIGASTPGSMIITACEAGVGRCHLGNHIHPLELHEDGLYVLAYRIVLG
jgi:hypothetical protein